MTEPLRQPRFSIIIPTRHRNDTLAACLDCLSPAKQTLASDLYEIVVTDDGSSSTAEAMLRERYPWVRWVAGPRRGPASNRNNGAHHATGEWLIFTDDDCLPDPGWLNAYAEAIRPDYRVYEGKTSCPDGTGSVLEFAPVNEDGGWLWSCNMMFHRTVFEKIGGFDESFPSAHMEDVDLRERLKAADIAFLFVPSALILHPARRADWRENMGLAHQSEVMFWFKSGNDRPMWPTLFRNIVIGRARWILSHRLGFDSFVFAGMTIRELFYVLVKIADWERTYRLRYASTERL